VTKGVAFTQRWQPVRGCQCFSFAAGKLAGRAPLLRFSGLLCVLNPVGSRFANEIDLRKRAAVFQPGRLDFEGPEAEWRSAAFAWIAKLGTGAAGFLKAQNQRPSVPGRLAG
jgi:hypothetical protein